MRHPARLLMRSALLSLLAASSAVAQTSVIERTSQAVALLYAQDERGGMVMRCTATAFERDGNKTRFISAAHCVGEDDLQREKTADASGVSLYISFDAKGEKRFYPATVTAIGFQRQGHDFLIVEVETKETWTTLPLGKDDDVTTGSTVVNVASPLGLGKQLFRGTVTMPVLDRPLIAGDINWRGAMLLQMSVGPGSSGSAIVSEDGGVIVGFLVGTVQLGGSPNTIAIPVSKFRAFQEAVEAKRYRWSRD